MVNGQQLPDGQVANLKAAAPSIVDAIGPGGPTRFKNTGFVPAYVGESR